MTWLLDTHGLIWALAGDDRLSPRARSIVADPANRVLVSAATAWEVALKVAIGRLTIPVAPERLIEIVTGSVVARNLDDRACELAILTMTSCFQADDIVGGVREGVLLLAQHARHPRVLHLDEPA